MKMRLQALEMFYMYVAHKAIDYSQNHVWMVVTKEEEHLTKEVEVDMRENLMLRRKHNI